MSLMSFLFGKSKMSCQELVDMLAPRFANSTLERFENEKENEHSWITEATKEKCRTDPLKEWVLFNLAAYVTGCRLAMKPGAIHFEFVGSFIADCASDFVKRAVFKTETEFAQLAMERMADYSMALEEADAVKKMLILSGKFLRNVGCDSDDIVYHMAASGSFMSELTATKTMFEDILKTIHLQIPGLAPETSISQ